MVVEKSSTAGNALEQFVILAKSAKGAACSELVKQALEAPGVYVFGELLDNQNISELENTNKIYFNTLNLFAYGTYKDYLASQKEFIELSPAHTKKLQHLTIVTLATKSKVLYFANQLCGNLYEFLIIRSELCKLFSELFSYTGRKQFRQIKLSKAIIDLAQKVGLATNQKEVEIKLGDWLKRAPERSRMSKLKNSVTYFYLLRHVC